MVKNVKEDWNSMAEAYEVFNNSPDSYSFGIEWPCIRSMLPELSGKEILDLGCGTGIFTFLLEQFSPASLTGIDLSEEMLKIAEKKAKERGSCARFIQGDAGNASEFLHQEYDFVFSSTMTHYIDDLEKLFENIRKCLKDGGTGILSVIHPVYSAMYPVEHGDTFPEEEEWVVRYLDRSKRAYIQPWIEYNDDFENQLSRSFHHTVSDYINALLKAGLKLEEIREPMPPEEWKRTCPGRYEGYLETPVYMIFKIKNDGL